MKKRHSIKTVKLRAVTIVLFLGFVVCCFFYPRAASKFFTSAAEPAPTPQKRQIRSPRKPKYSEFSHSVAAHKTSCNSCHKFPSANWKQVRKGDVAFPDITEYPRHESCLNCHRRQFFSGSPPTICSICHTNPSLNNSSRHAFPNPREIFDATAKGRNAVSDFAVSFPHDKHIEIVSALEKNPEARNVAAFAKANFRGGKAGEESCAVCHKTYQPQGDSGEEFFTKPPAGLGDAFWLKKGTFKTSPIDHARCFSCHSTETGILPAPSDCAACHKLKPSEPRTDFDAKIAAPMKIADKIVLHAWRKRDSSATFRHEFSSHAEMECATCHNAAAINTLDALTKKVKVNSCAPCHITAKTDDGGILNYEIDERKKNANFQCVKCHIAFGRSAIPESHLKAVAEQQ